MRLFQYRVALMSICLLVAVALSRLRRSDQTPPVAQAPGAGAVPAAAPAVSQVERGRMLIIGGGCHDCHTPKKIGPNGPEADMDRACCRATRRATGVPPPFKQMPGQPVRRSTSTIT